jgi:hypothetical protein
MEYVIGSVLTLTTIFCCNLLLRNKRNKIVKIGVRFSQSRLHEITKPINSLTELVKALSREPIPTQSRKHYAAQHVRVIMSESEAYWISNNRFYVADVRDNLIIQETTREVDTMVMDDVQLKKIMEIVEMLGDNNDSGSSRNKGF